MLVFRFLEIVSDPDIHSPQEAMLYLEKLRELLLYSDVSDVKIEEGSMRCDVNVSVSKTDQLGVRAEIKKCQFHCCGWNGNCQ